MKRNKIKITLEEFKEYISLKAKDDLINKQLCKMEFISGLSIVELC